MKLASRWSGQPDPTEHAADGDARYLIPSVISCYIIFFFSGAAALIYEVSWQRQIGLLFGHTVHSAAIVLASYLTGMGLGYVVGARFAPRVSPLRGYAISEVVAATWACLIPAALDLSESPELASWLSSSSVLWQKISRALFSFLLLLPATAALGATLPMMAEWLSQDRLSMTDERIAGRISLAYAMNTGGALVGVLASTFLLAIVGVRTSSYLAAGLAAVCAVAALGLASTQRRTETVSTRRRAKCENPIALDSSDFPPLLPCFPLAALCGFGTLAL